MKTIPKPSFPPMLRILVALLLFTLPAVASLTPIRATNSQGNYTINTVGDAKHPAPENRVRILVRISQGGSKKPIKPESIRLVDASGNQYTPADSDDKDTSAEKGSGLPLTVSPGVDSYGNTGVGLGLNMNSLMNDHSVYSYTKVDFDKKDFIPGRKLMIVLPNGKVLKTPLTEIAE